MSEKLIEISPGESIWLGRMGKQNGIPILLVHGAIENSRIFYSEKGKGLAPFLAENGYDVFVTDLRGKGKSIPAANSGKVKAGQYELITHDLPVLINEIKKEKGEDCPVHLMAHSWGGVLISSWYARFAPENQQIRSFTFFACKRKIYVQHIKRWLMVDLVWTCIGSIATRIKGYLPAKKLRLGAEDEPAGFFFECNKWVYSDHWIDPRDQFNYKERFKEIDFPPVLSLTGMDDHSLGNAYCVKRMLEEINPADLTHIDLGKANGHMHNYGHIDILTHADAPSDHFQLVLNWLNQHN